MAVGGRRRGEEVRGEWVRVRVRMGWDADGVKGDGSGPEVARLCGCSGGGGGVDGRSGWAGWLGAQTADATAEVDVTEGDVAAAW